jgi:hypothetical protein
MPFGDKALKAYFATTLDLTFATTLDLTFATTFSSI